MNYTISALVEKIGSYEQMIAYFQNNIDSQVTDKVRKFKKELSVHDRKFPWSALNLEDYRLNALLNEKTRELTRSLPDGVRADLKLRIADLEKDIDKKINRSDVDNLETELSNLHQSLEPWADKIEIYKKLSFIESQSKMAAEDILGLSGLGKFYRTLISSNAYYVKTFINNFKGEDKKLYFSYRDNKDRVDYTVLEIEKKECVLIAAKEVLANQQEKKELSRKKLKMLEAELAELSKSDAPAKLLKWQKTTRQEQCIEVISTLTPEVLSVCANIATDRKLVKEFIDKRDNILQLMATPEKQLLAALDRFKKNLSNVNTQLNRYANTTKMDFYLDEINSNYERLKELSTHVIDCNKEGRPVEIKDIEFLSKSFEISIDFQKAVKTSAASSQTRQSVNRYESSYPSYPSISIF